jgi:hypothetical protein
MAAEEKAKTIRDKMHFQKKELISKQRTLNTFNLVEGKPFEGRKVFECPKCKGKCFTSKSYLKAHCKRRHPEGIDEAPTLKRQTGLDKERVDPYSEQAEELKSMQTKLKKIISQATMSMNIAEDEKDNKEAANLRQTLNELDDKYRKIQDQLWNIQHSQKAQEDKLLSLSVSKPVESKVTSQYESIMKGTTSKLSRVEKKEDSSMHHERADRFISPGKSVVADSRQEESKDKPPIDGGRAGMSTVSERMERSLDFRGERNMHAKSLYIGC